MTTITVSINGAISKNRFNKLVQALEPIQRSGLDIDIVFTEDGKIKFLADNDEKMPK